MIHFYQTLFVLLKTKTALLLLNNDHIYCRSNLKKWETVAKHGPEAVESLTNDVENQEVTKPAAKLRRTKTNGNKKGKNVGKDRFPTHKVKR